MYINYVRQFIKISHKPLYEKVWALPSDRTSENDKTKIFWNQDNNQVLERKKYSKVYQCESVGQKQKKEEDCVII